MQSVIKSLLTVEADKVRRKAAELQELHPAKAGVFGYQYGRATGLAEAVRLIEQVEAQDYYRKAAEAGQFDLWADCETPEAASRRIVAQAHADDRERRERESWNRALRAGLVAGEYQPHKNTTRRRAQGGAQ